MPTTMRPLMVKQTCPSAKAHTTPLRGNKRSGAVASSLSVLPLLGLSALLAGTAALAHLQLTRSFLDDVLGWSNMVPPSHSQQSWPTSVTDGNDGSSRVEDDPADWTTSEFSDLFEVPALPRGQPPNAGSSGFSSRRNEAPPSFLLHSTFPKWGGDEPHGEGIKMSSLLGFVEGVVQEDPSLGQYVDALVYVWGNGASRNATQPSAAEQGAGAGGGVWASEALRRRTANNPTRFRMVPRFQAVEPALRRAWSYLVSSARHGDEVARSRWPALLRVTESGGAFPILLWHADFKGCNRHNFMTSLSVPILTTCANIHCNYSFPFPNYRTVKDSFPDSKSWDHFLRRQSEECPWHQKRSQVVWRGSLTGPTPRIRLGMLAAQQRDNPLLDIGIYRLPAKKEIPAEVLEKVLMKPSIPAENFTRYKAILDIDGNSWSARFGKLLCSNSVILKVEPTYVDYFYKHLAPWKHYVPIREDLSDLLAKAEWVLDPHNEDRVLQIVDSANEWCRVHMTHAGVTHDVLDILNEYVLLLDRDDGDWWGRWGRAIARLWDPQSRLDMRNLEG